MKISRLTEVIKAFSIDEGADLVGIAPVERWKNAPIELSPQGIWPEAKSVIVIAVNLTDAGVELVGIDNPQEAGIGKIPAWVQLDHIAFRIGKFIEKKGFNALPIVNTSLWRYRPYKNIDNGNSFLPDISHIHAGAAAGLGEIGYSGLLITPEFGPRIRLSSIITNAPLEPNPMYDGPPLCDRCMVCVRACNRSGTRALTKETNGECVVKIGGKKYTYVKINKWRCAWGEHFSIDLESIPIPEKINEKTVIEALKKYDVKGWLQGRCQMYCLPPHLRDKTSENGKPYHKKKQFTALNEFPNDNRVVTGEVKRIAIQKGVDLVKIVSLDDFRDLGVNLKNYLPDAHSAIILGVENVKGGEEKKIEKRDYARSEYPRMEEIKEGMQENYLASDIAQQRLAFIGFGVTKYLESLGYSVLCCVKYLEILGDKLKVLSGNNKDQRMGLIITSAPLFADVRKKATVFKEKEVETTAKKSCKRFTAQIKALAIQRGADLIGIAPVERFQEIDRQLEEIAIREERDDYFIVQDVGRMSKGPFVPKVIPKKLKVKTPFNYLSDAKSVIVLGMHYFDAALETAGKPPAEAVGPYGFAQSETISQLDDIALDVIKLLRDNGYESVFSYDLTGLAGLVTGSCASGRSYYGMPWRGAGLYPAATANRYAAIAAGLGELGWSGLVLTPEYGVRQRFVSIITNASLNPDPIYQGPSLCKRCFKCVGACPVSALSKDKKISLKIGNKVFEYGACERLRCDWAKRYGLIGDTGPKYIGSQTNIMPPEEITPDNLCEALKRIDPLQKACMCIVEKCIEVCSPNKMKC